jgi:hypothetical protein
VEVAGRWMGLWKPPARGRGGGGRQPVEEATVGGGMEEAAFYPLENEDRGSILWKTKTVAQERNPRLKVLVC